jgi:hypothetical protein
VVVLNGASVSGYEMSRRHQLLERSSYLTFYKNVARFCANR